MIIVIIAGGQGTRLWPLSTNHKPKHLLSLTNEKSLLRNTYERVSKLTDKIYIIPEQSHADQILEHLPELTEENLFVEPGRRGTASCIMLALAKLHAKYGDDEDVAFLHADHHITNPTLFTDAVELAVSSARKNNTICLIGLNPTYPATGFGYIKLGDKAKGLNGAEVFEVDSFVEKPDLKTAQDYLKSGQYLWNLGLFAAPIKSFVSAFKQYNQPLYAKYQELLEVINDKDALDKKYLSFDNLVIEYELMEKIHKPLVVPGAFGWADIGSFSDLHEILGSANDNVVRTNGNESSLLDCDGCLVMSTNTNKPVITIGLRDIVVIDTPNGTLVCHKRRAQDIKKALEQLTPN